MNEWRHKLKKLIGAMLATLLMFSLLPAVPAMAAEYWEGWTELPTTAGGTLSGNYKVTSSKTITNSSTSGNGLVISGTVTIYIKPGCTLTVNGGAGSARNGGGAGIYLPSTATLILRGGGTLDVTGGNGGTAVIGNPGGSGYAYVNNVNTRYGYGINGAGGGGGAGAGGAGAGIGGSGGAGGTAGTNGVAVNRPEIPDWAYYNGNSSNTGGGGSAGTTMGILHVLDTVTVKAKAGNRAAEKQGGAAGADKPTAYNYFGQNGFLVAGGGGGGGAGGIGGIVADIGGGSGGGGGGGGGGAGALLGASLTYTVTAAVQSGGNSDTVTGRGGNGGRGTSFSRTAGDGQPTALAAGGSGSNGGAAGANGGNGTVYKASGATLEATPAGTLINLTDITGTVTIGYTYNDGANVILENTRVTSAVVTLSRKISTDSNYTIVSTQTVNFDKSGDSDTQSFVFEVMPDKNPAGNAYSYIVTTQVSDYDASSVGNDITLTFNPNNFNVGFEITADNIPERARPDELHVKILYCNPTPRESEGDWVISQHTNTYLTAINQNGVYRGTYPVWKYEAGTQNAYGYKIIIIAYTKNGVTYPVTGDIAATGAWVYYSGEAQTHTMTATLRLSAFAIAVNDEYSEYTAVVDTPVTEILTPAEVADPDVTLSIKVSDTDIMAHGAADIDLSTQGKVVQFFDISVIKTVGETTTPLTSLSKPITIRIPLAGTPLAGKTSLIVWRYHGGIAEQLTGNQQDAEYFEQTPDEVIIHARKFSTYAVISNEKELNLEHSHDVDVQAKITGEGGSVYKIDIAWGAMTFAYSTSGVWDPDTHSYDEDATVGWLQEGFISGNNKITAYNHSNGDVLVSFGVVPELGGVDMTVKPINSADNNTTAINMLLGKVPFETADAPSIDAYLWLDGKPDDPSTLEGTAYTKIAVITVTIEATGDERTPPDN